MRELFGKTRERIRASQQEFSECVASDIAILFEQQREKNPEAPVFSVSLFARSLGAKASFWAKVVGPSMSRERFAQRVGKTLDDTHGLKAVIHSVYEYGGDSTSEDVGTDVVINPQNPHHYPREFAHEILGIFYPDVSALKEDKRLDGGK